MPHPERYAPSPEAVGVDPEKLEALFERAAREVEAGELPSTQIAVARDGKLAGMRTVGRATCGGVEQEASDDTLYTIFSCTKAITSAAAWLLIEDGTLEIGERVSDTIPEFRTNGKEAVTVEQLFTHTAGFPHAPSNLRDWVPRSALRDRMARWRLTWEPGTRFEYHPSSGMWVLALLIEERSGLAFGDFVRTRIAEPLGVELWVGLPEALDARTADLVHVGRLPTPEEFQERGFPVPPETEVTEEALQRFNAREFRAVGVPGGGGIATAADLALFYQALLHDGRGADGTEVWKPETIEMALEVRSGDLKDPMFGKRANRALGLVVAGDSDRTFRGFGHTHSPHSFGHLGAGGQLAWADPETGISLGYVTNGFERDPIKLARRGVGLSSRAASLAL